MGPMKGVAQIDLQKQLIDVFILLIFILGVELIVPAKCYMCSICKDLFMELYEIVDHLNSKEHHNQYRVRH